MRACPVCKTELMGLKLQSGTVIELCSLCNGLWFDHEELENVQHHDDALKVILQARHANASPLLCRSCGTFNPRQNRFCSLCALDITLRCVNCDVSLEEVMVGNLMIDRCNKCKGVWLDGGELAILFREFQQIRDVQSSRGKARTSSTASDVAGTVGDITLSTLIWAPELFVYSGIAVAEAARHLPGLLARGADGAVDLAGQVPDIAAKAAEMSAGAVSGAVDMAGRVPEAASAVYELISSFIAAIIEAIGD